MHNPTISPAHPTNIPCASHQHPLLIPPTSPAHSNNIPCSSYATTSRARPQYLLLIPLISHTHHQSSYATSPAYPKIFPAHTNNFLFHPAKSPPFSHPIPCSYPQHHLPIPTSPVYHQSFPATSPAHTNNFLSHPAKSPPFPHNITCSSPQNPQQFSTFSPTHPSS